MMRRYLTILFLALVLFSAPGAARATDGTDEERTPFEVHFVEEQADEEESPAATAPPSRRPLREPRDGPFRVLGLENNPALENSILDAAFESRRRIRESTRLDWTGTAVIVWVGGEDYAAQTGHSAEFTAAAANSRLHTIWINADSWARSSPEDRQNVLTHELGHLLVGNLIGHRRLPLWVEEGLVMHLAGEWDWERTSNVLRAHMFNRLPRLERLESGFPREPDTQGLAYSYSYYAVGQLARDMGDRPNEVRVLMAVLAHPERGPQLIDELWTTEGTRRIEALVHDSLGNRLGSALALFSTGTAIWIGILFLAIAAWFVRRMKRRAFNRTEEEEEAWASSLTEKDIKDVWGEDESFSTEENEMPWDKWERIKDEER